MLSVFPLSTFVDGIPALGYYSTLQYRRSRSYIHQTYLHYHLLHLFRLYAQLLTTAPYVVGMLKALCCCPLVIGD